MSSRTRHAIDAAGQDARAALAEAQLRAASVRITSARVKVLAALLDAGRACSHQDMQDALAGMDRVTLYRALDCLTDAGLAHKIAGDDRVFRYSAGADHGSTHHQHGHFKCTRCARVFCLDSIAEAELLEKALQDSLGKGFRSHDIEFTVKGWCADCAQ
ncbi:Fur family transcriptional regulator [Noviherbaspirillum aridicola]|uniref:Transcriptional regulator n=1 Tax=Noviherbaspirillum aridicola TaxID=2849687 RepID=A0ABQ4Q0U5_9BURK|nr:Fur family transcriptional regulator [Noviherbaspirillum aridicola]GIZ50791.1 transcriptional regulator [Noviherbaspirillum aridicola]